MAVPLNLEGMRFSRLVVLRRAQEQKQAGVIWVCLCDCGTETLSLAAKLRNGHKRSCGCLAREANGSATHRESKSKMYIAWQCMRRRCHNPNTVQYPYYGGRGISVCAEWEVYEVFALWARDAGYADGLQLDRIDTNGNYEPANCRWVTKLENSRNRRVSARVCGIHVAEAAALLGIKYGTAIYRLRHAPEKFAAAVGKALAEASECNTP